MNKSNSASAEVSSAAPSSLFSDRTSPASGIGDFAIVPPSHTTRTLLLCFHDATTGLGSKYRSRVLALDEQRARFQPVIYRYQHDAGSTDEEETPNVKQVWFAGNHSDVGGESDQCLGHITLRWMVRECMDAEIGLRFKDDELTKIGLNVIENAETSRANNTVPPPLPHAYQEDVESDAKNGHVTDMLVSARWWWILEFVPMVQHKRVTINMGRGRKIPTPHSDFNFFKHHSVTIRIEDGKLPKAEGYRALLEEE